MTDKGTPKPLPTTYNQGYCYFDKTTGRFWIDTIDGDANGRVQINTSLYAVCNTAANVAKKEITIPGLTLTEGTTIYVKFTNSNSIANPTLAVNGGTAYSIKRYGTTAPSTSAASSWNAGSVIALTFDGTQWQMQGWLNSTYTVSNLALGQGYGTCTTAESTTAKAVTMNSYALSTGGIVAILFSNAVPANATLNINGKGAKNIFYNGAKITANVIQAGDLAYFMYDSAQYQFLGTSRANKEAITGLSISNNTITYTKADGNSGTLAISDTKYTAGAGINITGNTITNIGVVTIGTPTNGNDGTLAVKTGDTITNVAVKGWNTKANLDSPAFTGTPTAPTPEATSNNTTIATTAFVKTAIQSVSHTHAKLKFGANGAFEYDGTTDVTVPVYDGTYSVS